jgi:hypothetical protein
MEKINPQCPCPNTACEVHGNCNQTPSYNLLFRLIRELEIPADSIFYPEQGYDRAESERLWLLLEKCDEREISAITATLQTLLTSKNSNGR